MHLAASSIFINLLINLETFCSLKSVFLFYFCDSNFLFVKSLVLGTTSVWSQRDCSDLLKWGCAERSWTANILPVAEWPVWKFEFNSDQLGELTANQSRAEAKSDGLTFHNYSGRNLMIFLLKVPQTTLGSATACCCCYHFLQTTLSYM